MAVWKTGLIALLVLGTVSIPAAAQSDKPKGNSRPIYSGLPVNGQIISSDEKTKTQDSYHQDWKYSGEAGERITVSVSGTGFNPAVAVYTESDDFVGEGPSTGTSLVLPASGEYTLCIHSHDGLQTGSFKLTVNSSEFLSEWEALVRLKSDGKTTGKLGHWAGDQVDDWYFFGTKDQLIRIEMRPQRIAELDEDFDTFLRIGRIENGKFHELASDDDGAGGKASLLNFRLPDVGMYIVRASAYGDKPVKGHYSISLEKPTK